ncbi:MAG: hypothetical protein KA072_11975 [Thermoanaerobaculaceae bacterium]|nr:hypothetical protein [Thermoanaerobaculaceae bacterium]MDI9621653.1 hypothetical protein [Acidobacteriota bacterium]NLH10765.1 hypothetical protein [Holophagae bacterium]HPW55974.1 hypothetical protein [Thermoanaerobaculaceae bacterium]
MGTVAGLAILVVTLVGSGIGPPCGLLTSPAPAHRCSCCPADQPCGCCTGSPAPADHERSAQQPPRATLDAPTSALVPDPVTDVPPTDARDADADAPHRGLAALPAFLAGHAFRC